MISTSRSVRFAIAFVMACAFVDTGREIIAADESSASPPFVEPQPFAGRLVLISGDAQHDVQVGRPGSTGFGIGKEAQTVLIVSRAEDAVQAGRVAAALRSTTNAKFRFVELVSDTTSIRPPSPVVGSLERAASWTAPSNSKDAVVVVSLPSCRTESEMAQWNGFGKKIKHHLEQGGTVCLMNDTINLAGDDEQVDAQGNKRYAWHLLPKTKVIVGSNASAANESADRVRLVIDGPLNVQFDGRDVRTRGTGRLHVHLPPTVSCPSAWHKQVDADRVADFTTWQRALAERNEAAFPSAERVVPELKSGSLVIVGGGGATAEIWQSFIDLAGGVDSKFIILPTAQPGSTTESGEARLLRRMGVENVVVLPQIDRDEVSSAEYLKQFEDAQAVWFGGGRQWHFVDAYAGTPAWQAIHSVLQRGGVIGGSSAGATIQGDLLVRGSPLGNQIMIEDGYRRGLGLIRGIAVDQHFRQRNRFDELEGCLRPYPGVLGIGIDESTALIVQAPSAARVIGNGSVWILPTAETAGVQRAFAEYPTGSKLDLKGPFVTTKSSSAGDAKP
ncbi:MAG: cyanophycinase [Pirellulales bacterium]